MDSVAMGPSNVSCQCLYWSVRVSNVIIEIEHSFKLLWSHANRGVNRVAETPTAEAAAQRGSQRLHPGRHHEERREGVPPPRLSRRDRRTDRRGAQDEERQPLLLLQEQGSDPFRLPPVLARRAHSAAGGSGTERAVCGREAAPTDRGIRTYDPRRVARHRAVSGSGGLVAGAFEGGDPPPRHLRSRRASRARGRDGHGDVRTRRRQTARLRAVRSRQLDPAVVQPGRPRKLSGDCRSLRRFPDRRTQAARNALIGLSRAIRTAGTSVATTVTMSTTAAATPNVSGSLTEIPHTR